MNIALWVVAGLLAVAFFAAGLMKALRPKDQLAASGLAWVEDFSAPMVKLIGVLEVLAAIGLILPALLDIAPIFVPLAAVGLVLMMIGAMVVHARRKEYPMLAPNLVLLLLAAFVAWGRFGAYAF